MFLRLMVRCFDMVLKDHYYEDELVRSILLSDYYSLYFELLK